MTDQPKNVPSRVQHVAGFQPVAEGVYRVSCDACSFSERGAMTRNGAYDRAYLHTQQGAK